MKNIRVSYAFAYFGNPVVGQGFTDIKEGDGWKSAGIEITPDHQHIFIEPVVGMNQEPMKCEVYFRKTPLTQLVNWLTGQPPARLSHLTITSRRRFKLSQIYSVTSYDGYDDSTHSFSEISEAEVVPDDRTRKIFDEHQILSPDQLIRGKVLIYHGWHSGLQTTIPERMVVLSGAFNDSALNIPHFKGLFLKEDCTTWEFHPSLQNTTVSPSEDGYYGNHTYLVDTGKTMTEEEIASAFNKRKNP